MKPAIKIDRFEKYTNGNYDVMISPITGTKIRDNHRDDNLFDAEFPECADICITSYCDRGCPFCYVSSGENGRDAPFDEMKPTLDTFRPWTEVALGGGSPILHKELVKILEFFKTKNVLPSITVHWKHFEEKFPFLMDMCKNGLLYGVGVSAASYREDVSRLIVENRFRNAVIHTIVMIHDQSCIVGIHLLPSTVIPLCFFIYDLLIVVICFPCQSCTDP